MAYEAMFATRIQLTTVSCYYSNHALPVQNHAEYSSFVKLPSPYVQLVTILDSMPLELLTSGS
jgi:hypothetical protein